MLNPENIPSWPQNQLDPARKPWRQTKWALILDQILIWTSPIWIIALLAVAIMLWPVTVLILGYIAITNAPEPYSKVNLVDTSSAIKIRNSLKSKRL